VEAVDEGGEEVAKGALNRSTAVVSSVTVFACWHEFFDPMAPRIVPLKAAAVPRQPQLARCTRPSFNMIDFKATSLVGRRRKGLVTFIAFKDRKLGADGPHSRCSRPRASARHKRYCTT
jgi:hypothetical protein